MTLLQRLAELAGAGVRLWEENGQLKCSFPSGVMTEALKSELKRNKAEILGLIRARTPSGDIFRDTPISAAPHRPSYRLSPQQRRYIADFTWDNQRTWSTILFQAPLPIPCSPQLFRKAFEILCARHDCLRTTFPEFDGERRQQISPEPALAFSHIHAQAGQYGECLAELRALAQQTQWDTKNGPMGKLTLATGDGDNPGTVLLSFHRVIMDGASIRILMTEFFEILGMLSRGQAPAAGGAVQYRDFSEWLNGLEGKGHFESSRHYWVEELGLPLPDPFAFNTHGNPVDVSTEAAIVIGQIPKAITDELSALARQDGKLLPMFLFAIFTYAMWKADSGSEFVMDTSLIGRNRTELRHSLGFFTNAAAIRVKLSPDMSFSALVSLITRKFAAAEQHQYFQYDRIVDALGIDRKTTLFPLSGILFNTLENAFPVEADTAGQTVWKSVPSDTRYGLMFYVMRHPECYSVELKYRVALLEQESARAIVEAFAAACRYLVTHDTGATLAQMAGVTPQKER